jgi:hypothetical protein
MDDAALQREWSSVQPFGADDQRDGPRTGSPSKLDGSLVAERLHPRSFLPHPDHGDPCSGPTNGYALWTTTSLLALPGLSVRELEPVDENGVELTGFQAQFGLDFASHSTLQEFYFGPDLLLERHDYRVDIAGGFSAIQYISDLVEADGIRVPTKRRAYRCDEDGRPILSEVMVSIDLSDVRFS